MNRKQRRAAGIHWKGYVEVIVASPEETLVDVYHTSDMPHGLRDFVVPPHGPLLLIVNEGPGGFDEARTLEVLQEAEARAVKNAERGRRTCVTISIAKNTPAIEEAQKQAMSRFGAFTREKVR